MNTLRHHRIEASKWVQPPLRRNSQGPVWIGASSFFRHEWAGLSTGAIFVKSVVETDQRSPLTIFNLQARGNLFRRSFCGETPDSYSGQSGSDTDNWKGYRRQPVIKARCCATVTRQSSRKRRKPPHAGEGANIFSDTGVGAKACSRKSCESCILFEGQVQSKREILTILVW